MASKISSLLGMESKARRRKAGSVDIAKVAGTKIPRMLFDTFGGGEIPILESAFSKWEAGRNKLADAKLRKKATDARYRADPSDKKSAQDMVAEARKSREDAKQASQAQAAHQTKVDAYQSAVADQGSSQVKLLGAIRDELTEIKGALRIGGKQVGKPMDDAGGGILSSIWNLVPGKLKGKLGGKAAEIAEKIGGKRLGTLVKGAAMAAGAEGLEKTAAEVAGSGLGAAAKTVAPEAAGEAAAHSGGLLGRVAGYGKSALGAAGGLIDSGKSAIGSLFGKGGEKAGASAGGKLLGEEGEKLGGKMLLKEGGKAIPLLGNVIGLATSLGFAGKRLWEGDVAGAAMETGSGLLNLIPGVGNYLSIAADLAIAGRDIKKANAAKKVGDLVGGGEAASKVKTAKEISEEGAKVVEEKADQSGEEHEKEDKKQDSKLTAIGKALNPIGTAHAEEVPAANRNVTGKVVGITAAGAGMAALASTAGASPASEGAAAKNKANPIERLAGYMAGLFDLASDDTKGIYVTQSNAPFQGTPPPPQPSAPSASADQGVPTTSTISSDGTMTATASRSSVGSLRRTAAYGGGGLQPGAETNGGWHTGGGGGSLSMNPVGGSTGGSVGAAPQNYGKAGDYDIDQMWEQMKGTIAQGESGSAGYDAHHGGTIQGLSNMTIGQLRKMKGAMGKYQLLPGTTLGMAARAVGLSDNDTFSPANQEAMGKWLFARRVKMGARQGPAGIQAQLANEWASLPKDASGRGVYDGVAGNQAAGGSGRASQLSSIISGSSATGGSMAGITSNTANDLDHATDDVARNDQSSAPTVVVAPGGSKGGSAPTAAAGTGGGVSGPMVTRNTDSSVQSITQNFISGSSAMG